MIFLLLVAFASLCLCGHYLYTIYEEHRQITSFPQAPAIILTARLDLEIHPNDEGGGDTITYLPFIKYQYTIRGHAYTNTRIIPTDSTFSAETAGNIVSRFSSGSPTVAYYDPDHPENAFLLPFYISAPHHGALVTFALASLCLLLARSNPFAGTTTPPIPTNDGRFVLTLPYSLSARFTQYAILALVWHALGLTLAYHYFRQPLRSPQLHPLTSFFLFELLGLLPLFAAYRNAVFLRCLSLPLLFLDVPELIAGQTIHATIEQRFHRRPQTLRLDLRCEKSSSTEEQETTLFHKDPKEAPLENLRIDQDFSAGFTFVLPDEPSFFSAKYKWTLRLCVSIPFAPSFTAAFPLASHAPGSAPLPDPALTTGSAACRLKH
jgi:hypothetical protein